MTEDCDVMFNRVYYDARTSTIHLWETINGQRLYNKYPFNHIYYITDQTGLSEIKDIYGNAVTKKVATSRREMINTKDTGIKCFETDIHPEVKFLHERYEGVKLSKDISNFNICYIDIEIESSPSEFPKPQNADYPINLITVKFSKSNKIYTFGNRPYTNDHTYKNFSYYYIPDEKNMIEKFISVFRKEKADCITGWNSHVFDIPYIINRQNKLGITKSLSPLNIVTANKYGEYNIAGIADLDYLMLYRDKFTFDKKDSYSLQSIGTLEVGEGKLDYEGEIFTLYKTDWNAYVEYNIQDVLLVEKIEAKKKFIELTLDICFQALIPFNRIFSTIAMHEGYILSFMHKQKMVMPDLLECEEEEYPGAYVEAHPGKYKYVISFDVASLYPTIIMRDNIGPETLKVNPTIKDGLLRTPLSDYTEWDTKNGKRTIGGVFYDNSKQSVLSQVVETIINERKHFKLKMKICQKRDNKADLSDSDLKILKEIDDESGTSSYYNSQQHIRKIMINSLYGALGNRFFHLYNTTNAMNITLSGQHLIKYLGKCFNDYFKNYFWKNKNFFTNGISEKNKLTNDIKILTDTDSVYICLQEIINKLNIKFNNNGDFIVWANNFIDKVLNPLINNVLNVYAEQFGTKQLIDFKREKIISKMLIMGKKHYVTEVLDNEGVTYIKPKVILTGMETKKTSTPIFIREKFNEVLMMLLNDSTKDDVVKHIKQIRIDFEKTDINNISKPMTIKDYDKYTKNVDYYISNGLSFNKGMTKQIKAALLYNFLIKKHNLPLIPIGNGTKIKFINICARNEYNANVIGFINKIPEIFKQLFEIDWDSQWESVADKLVSGWFEVMGWGKLNLTENSLKKFFKTQGGKNVV